MREVKAWETSDNQLFTDQEKAQQHQQAITLRGKLTSFWKEFGWDGMEFSDAVDVCIDNLDRLKRAIEPESPESAVSHWASTISTKTPE